MSVKTNYGNWLIDYQGYESNYLTKSRSKTTEPNQGTLINKLEIANYPNPFNPTTNLRYQIPKDSHIKIKIFDVTGRELETLVDQFQSAGMYTIKFDGGKYSSGVYICVLYTEKNIRSSKMLLLK